MIIRYGFFGAIEGLGIPIRKGGASALSAGGTGDRVYNFWDFFIAQKQNMINNPIGIGWVLSILVLLGVGYSLWKYRSRLMVEQSWLAISIFWLIFTFWGVNGETFPISVTRGAFRMWMVMAIPLAIGAMEGVYFVQAFSSKKLVKIGIVGKYFNTGEFTLADSYVSVIESIRHAGWSLGLNPKISWLNSEIYEKNPKILTELKKYDGIVVPGGFGARGVEGKIRAIEFCRRRNIPFFGLCYGLQLAVVEFARNVCGLKGAHTTEVDSSTPYPVIDVLPEQSVNIREKRMGASIE